MNQRRLTVSCILLVIGLLIAGWQPFTLFPQNRAHWLTGQRGLGFEPDSFAYDPDILPPGEGGRTSGPVASFSIALWLAAGEEPNTDVFHVMTIDDGRLPSGLVLCQWKDSLLLRKPASQSPRGFVEVGAPVLQRVQPRLVILSSDWNGTDFYCDGQLIRQFPDFVLPLESLRGRLILGDSASGKHCWTGKVLGVLILDRSVAESDLGWVSGCLTNDAPDASDNQSGTIAFYRFDEGDGREVHDRSSYQHHLLIPSRYRVLQRTLLNVPWGPVGAEHLDRRDIMLNLIGFVPLGFLVYQRLRLSHPSRFAQNIFLTVLVGGGVSLMIEVGQVWLPMRDSSLLDLVCNLSGTCIGVCFVMLIHTSRNKPLLDSRECSTK